MSGVEPLAHPAVPPVTPTTTPPVTASSWLPAATGPRFWRRATGAGRSARPEAVLGILAVGLLTALSLPASAGVQWPMIFLLGAGAVLRSARRPVPWSDRWLAALVVGLGAVAAVRASAPTTALCLCAAVGLGALLAVGGRDWISVLATPVVLLVGFFRAVPWVARAAARRPRLSGGVLAWLRGFVLAVLAVWVCGALLSSADGAFAGLVSSLVPDVDLADLPARVVLGLIAVAVTAALAFAAAVPPRWAALRIAPRRARVVAEWLLPVAALDVLLAVFLAVQAAVLFDAYPDSLVSGNATPAERAREGFGQLVLTTLVVSLLLAWAARRTDPTTPRHRRLLVTAGGALLMLVLVVVASALRRLWLYEQAFGWTVLRLDVGVFEIWLGVLLVVAGVAWLLHRTAMLPRLVVGSAAAVLLGLSLAGPDAVVADLNVDRYERIGKIDLRYVNRLSDDAVPALTRLPEPLLSCALGGREVQQGPWYAANLSRARAQAALERVGPRPAPADGCWDDASA